MLSFDTNLAVYAANSSLAQHQSANVFISSLTQRKDVVICELMLVELYLKLRNPRIFPVPMGSVEAVTWCRRLAANTNWRLIDSAPVMPKVWELASRGGFAFRRIIDARLALTLQHHGVKRFATANTKDFDGFGFEEVWDPLEHQRL